MDDLLASWQKVMLTFFGILHKVWVTFLPVGRRLMYIVSLFIFGARYNKLMTFLLGQQKSVVHRPTKTTLYTFFFEYMEST